MCAQAQGTQRAPAYVHGVISQQLLKTSHFLPAQPTAPSAAVYCYDSRGSRSGCLTVSERPKFAGQRIRTGLC